ncbi:MAG: hypothetical protein IMW89_21595 [Ktedonobacteraceae bacterium]|nr:hypothetical protein [Ktedonobacteraceae bacterium]
MRFDLFHWLFDDPYTAGLNAGMSKAETFHFLWPWLIFAGAGLLIAFYYSVEGRKRFVKDRPIEKYMLDRYLGWLAIICFIALPLVFARVYMDQYFFAWRFWRYLWLLSLLVWAGLWIRYLITKYPKDRANHIAWQNRQQYIPKSSAKGNTKGSRRKAKAGSR